LLELQIRGGVEMIDVLALLKLLQEIDEVV
jgi:hypothetical protein